ncbi:HET-domain-containing protein [Xylariaceae sp. FL1019]|nr:HET-domain-containing protein [Xylariaceae sp. FL1019]
MWLLNTTTYDLEEFWEFEAPSYAILSHTWDKEEASFRDVFEKPVGFQLKAGYEKVKACCDLAARRGISYAWVDTCCIDKRNSADLSEALNSMYTYYRNAVECYIYFSDVSEEAAAQHETEPNAEIRNSKWLTRGWTLQELIAPKSRSFYTRHWSPIPSTSKLLSLIADTTSIPLSLLQDRDTLVSYCAAKRMSWAAKRITTRPEDVAYSLLGLFGVSMPILYGEGGSRAFARLQAAIMERAADHTLFVWRGPYESCGLLAREPSDFRDTGTLGQWAPAFLAPFTMTNVGLAVRLQFVKKPEHDTQDHRLAALQCDFLTSAKTWRVVFVRLRLIPGAHCYLNGQKCNAYRRVDCSVIETHNRRKLVGHVWEEALILQDEQYAKVVRSIEEHNARWGTEHSVETRQRYLGGGPTPPRWELHGVGSGELR